MSAKFSIQEIIEIAIEIEKNGASFYRSLSESLDNARLKELFGYLSKEEEKHISKFEDILKTVGGYQISEVYYITDYMGYMKAIADGRVFKSNASVLEFARNIKNLDEAIDTAIRFEKESLLFIHEMSEVVDDKEPIQKLLNEEREHIRRLSVIRQKLT